VAAYGAPAKGNTLLNTCAIGTDLVEYTVDRNPLKVGSYTPGAHLPIREVAYLAQDRPDYALILPWNIAPEIVAQERDFRAGGGRFLVPVPEPKILGNPRRSPAPRRARGRQARRARSSPVR